MADRQLEELVRRTVEQLLAQRNGGGVRRVSLPAVRVEERDRLDTGKPGDRVYTHDLFSLEESPRLGVGIMEMRESDFPWTLRYDEVDYVIEGELSVVQGERTVTAGPGELIYIPRDSSIRFSAPAFARFLYVTYPADWQSQ